MTHYVYTRRESGFEHGKDYRNPRFFERPYPDAESVEVEGDYPEIVKAYKEAGVAVVGRKGPSKAAVKSPAVQDDEVSTERVQGDPVDDKAALIEALAEYGIQKDSRSSVATLQKLLDEAEESNDD